MMRVTGNQVLGKLGRGCAAGGRAVGGALWRVMAFVPRSVVRLFTVDVGQVRVTQTESERLQGRAADIGVMRYLVWRRAMLFWAVLLMLANLGWQIHQSVQIFQSVDLEGLWSSWGYTSEIIRLSAIGMLPVMTLLGFLFWRRARLSGNLLVAGLVVATLVPICLVVIPAHFILDWENMGAEMRKAAEEFNKSFEESMKEMGVPAPEQPPPEQPKLEQLPLFQGPWKGLPVVHGVVDAIGALYLLVLLAPSLCAMFPGVLRACLRIKTLLPESTMPGWFTLAVLPLYLIYLLLMLAVLSTVYKIPELVVSLSLLVIAPLLHLLNMRSLLRPWRAPARRKSAYVLGWIAMFLYCVAILMMLTYFARKEIPFEGKTYYILSWLPENRLLFGYEDVGFWLADYFSRMLVITLVVADLLLRATASVWRQAAAGPSERVTAFAGC